MNISDIVLVVVGILAVVLTVYILKLISDVRATLAKVNTLLDHNETNINEVLQNVKKISSDAQTVTDRTAKAVKGVEKALGSKMSETGIATSVVKTKDALGIANMSLVGLKFLRTFKKKLKKF